MSGDTDLRALREQIVANQQVIDELNEAISRRTREVRVIQEIAAEINATLQLPEILAHILHAMDRVFGFHHAMVLLLEPDSGVLEVAACHGYPGSGVGAKVSVGQGVIGVVARRRKLMRVGNLRQQSAYAATVRDQMERAGQTEGLGEKAQLPGLEGAESQIAIPLLAKDELVGVFAVESERPNAFDVIDEQLIGLLAAQAASAVHNARLYQDEERRRRELADAHARLEALNAGLEERIRERTIELEAQSRHLEDALDRARIEQSRSTELLRMMAPAEVIPTLLEGTLRPHRLTATILFTDLQGFTNHSGRHEPDELFAQINDFFERMGAHIKRYRGYVNKTIGDGVMAVFGVPYQTETHALDAVLAALAMQAELAEGCRLPMRVGINTGTVTAGILGPRDKGLYDVLGDSVNVASRMEKLAPAAGIVISADTYAIVSPYLEVDPMGEQTVKGKGALACYRVVGPKPLLADRRRVDEGSIFATRFGALVDEVLAFRASKLAVIDFVSVQARDGALGHNEAVAAVALALRRFLASGARGEQVASDAAAVPEEDLLYLAFLHDLGKHALDPARLNGGLLTGAKRDRLVHDLREATLDALDRLGLGHLRGSLERLYRFEAARGAEPESDALVTLVAAADMYDALVAPKAYRGRSWSISGTLEELLRTQRPRSDCSVLQGLAELMRPADAVVTVRGKGQVVFR
jgi:adenylate cyclase